MRPNKTIFILLLTLTASDYAFSQQVEVIRETHARVLNEAGDDFHFLPSNVDTLSLTLVAVFKVTSTEPRYLGEIR